MGKMIKGYVSSDEDDDDCYDFGYSEPLVIEKKKPSLPPIQTQEVLDSLNSVLKQKSQISEFFKAAERTDFNTLENLIESGVSVDCTDSQEWTALLKACTEGNYETVRFLLEHHADPNKHKELLTPLMSCCTETTVSEQLKLNCVRLLLEHGADINAKYKYGTTALMYAAGSGYLDIVTELLQVPKISVSIQDNEGWTALFHAVNQNHLDIAKKLVGFGTNLKLKDKYGRTAVNLALDRNFKKMAEVLGYVEEKPCTPKPKVELKEYFLAQLPDSKGQGGFCEFARAILEAFNQFAVKEISLPDLLNASEKDLCDIGVKLQCDRHKILVKGIHRYHLKPWGSSSMYKIEPGVPISMKKAVIITGSFALHLTIANASLKYLSRRISSRQNKDLVRLAEEKKMITSLIQAYECANLMEKSLSEILDKVKEIDAGIPPDYIYPYKEEKHGKKFFKMALYTVGAASAGYLLYSVGSSISLAKLTALIINKVSLLFPFIQSESTDIYSDDHSIFNFNYLDV